ncbi:tetratricopeptide repeat protein [bacterium]|nr:tetratricopeptide repeat protein [bacterium]MBP9808790.1 tetratricopeptide repeat protein [bacterium]
MEADLTSIENCLDQMFDATSAQQFEDATARFQQALKRAKVVAGENGPLLISLLWLARSYESQKRIAHAEYFHRRAKHLLIDSLFLDSGCHFEASENKS